MRADAELIIDKPELPLFSGGSHWFAKWRSGEHSFIPALAELHRVDLSVPWRDLPATFQHAVLHGTGEQVIDASVTIPSRATGTEWTYSSSHHHNLRPLPNPGRFIEGLEEGRVAAEQGEVV